MTTTNKSIFDFDFDDYDLLVGIDFGTTFSGCAFVYTGDKEKNIVDVGNWPRGGNAVYPKAPTTSLYKPDGTFITWGKYAARKLIDYERRKEPVIYQSRFKLRLDNSVEMDSLPKGFTTIKLIADYLEEFHKHVLSEIKNTNAIFSNPDRIRYCLTVPAIWDDRAKSLMREAAIRAKIVKEDDHPLRLMLTSEPEAAAIYCEKQLQNYDLKPGNRFMICDAGGGTVDLIVFEITEDEDGERSLREVTKGSGNTCGSTFIDRNMEVLLRERLSHFGTVTNKAIRSMIDEFIEQTKHNFGDEGDKINEYEYLNFPNQVFESPSDRLPEYAAEFGIQDDKIGFSHKELCERVFDPVVNQTITLIEEQIKAAGKNTVDALFLVGGFGCSSYLYDSINKKLQGQIGNLSRVPSGEKAIARGAVYFGLSPTIVSARVLRRTYGVAARIKYDPALDDKSDLIKLNNQNYRQRGFSVYVKKGDTIEPGHHVLRHYTVKYPNDTEADIYAYDGDGAPPRTTRDPRVVRVSRFPIRMPTFRDLKDGDSVNMSIKMYFGQTEIKIEVVIRDRTFTCTSKYESEEEGLMLKNDLKSNSPYKPASIEQLIDSESYSDSYKDKQPKSSRHKFGTTLKKLMRS